MYDNIGSKIKIAAQIAFMLGVIGSMIFGLVICFGSEDFNAIGFLYILLGGIISWISTLLMYGFGELIERVCSIDKKAPTNTSLRIVNKRENSATIKKPITDITNKKENVDKNINKSSSVTHSWRCSNCNKMISDDVCPYCGHGQ